MPKQAQFIQLFWQNTSLWYRWTNIGHSIYCISLESCGKNCGLLCMKFWKLSPPCDKLQSIRIGSDVTYLWSQCDHHFVGQHIVLCVVKCEDLSRYSNKIESPGLRKYLYYRYLTDKVTSTDVRITNISQSLPHKMAENSWYEEIMSLSPMYTWNKKGKN